MVAPKLVDQAIGRDDLVAVEEQDGEHGALLGSAKGELTPFRADLERPENPKFHPRSASVTERVAGKKAPQQAVLC